MDPNQQPQNSGGTPPQPGQTPAEQPFYPNQQPVQPQFPQPQNQQPQAMYGPQAQSTPTPQNPMQPVYGPQPQASQQPSPTAEYGPQPSPTYAVDYLEQIAPPPPKAKFLSGSFGKIIVIMGVLMILAVSIIVAFGNQNKTADLEAITTKLDNSQKVATDVQRYLKSEDLSANNTNYLIWLTNNTRGGYDLLTKAGVQKNRIDKKVVASEKAAATKLGDEFTDARLNAQLDSTYAREMAYQTKLLKSALDNMSKRSQAKAIRDYAKEASKNLDPIQKNFADFKTDS